MEPKEQLILKRMMEAADDITKIDTAIGVMTDGISTDSDKALRGLAHAVGLLSDMRGELVALVTASAEVMVDDDAPE